MAKYVTLERPSEGVALVTLTHPEIRNHGSWEAIGNSHLDDALANEQKLFQALVVHEDVQNRMRAVQDRFDAGETPREVYGAPRE